MSKWTLWFMVAAFIAFWTLWFKYMALQNFKLDEAYKKKAILDWIIISKLDPVNFDETKVKWFQKSLPLKNFYNTNNKK